MDLENPNSLQQLNLDHVSPATRLLEKRRQMFEVQEALEAQKEEFARREDLFKRREEQLRKKDIDLQESLIRFNKFLQENDAKRARAEKKAADEIKTRAQKELEVVQLTQNLEVLTRDKERMKLVLEKNMRYLKYLEQVLEITEDYGEITELLDRHETLTEHHQDLTQWAQECAEKNDSYRNELQNYLKEGQDTKLKGHNEVAVLQKKLESQQLETSKLTANMDRKMIEQAERTLELGKIRWAIENLYERCRSQSKVSSAYHKDINSELKTVQDYMMDLAYMVKGASKLQLELQKQKAANPVTKASDKASDKERHERKKKVAAIVGIPTDARTHNDESDTNTDRASTTTDIH